MENKAGQFLERYREIEEWALNNLNVTEMKELEQMPQYKSLRSNLAFCRVLRNLLSHYDWSKAGNDLVIVTDQALRQVNNLYYSLNPQTLMRVAIRAGQIFAPAPTDSVLAAVKVMQRNDYSYIPIVENHQIVGVFSTKTIMRLVAEKSSLAFSESLTFKDIMDYIRLVDESNAHYGFINPNTTVEDVSLKFQRSKTRRVRLDMLFITDNGRSDGQLQGMVTPVEII
ncbi:MAG: CBS domain-containing protein [Bacteroidales bacterium]|jgi:CBS domain-containing protein|nr:CBS domain-containing protein [Bacteroidales bacterium]